MAMGEQGDCQGDLMVSWSEMPRAPGHVFYDRLQEILIAADFDGFAEECCRPFYAPRMGTPSVPPGRCFRMQLVGCFEGHPLGARAGVALFGFAFAGRASGEGDRAMLVRLARESGIETPSAEDLLRIDRNRKGKTLSNEDWVSKSDPEARIAKMKDGTDAPGLQARARGGSGQRRGGYRRDSPGRSGRHQDHRQDPASGPGAARTPEDPGECVADKGYHSRAVLKALDAGPWKTRVPGRRGSPGPSARVLRAGTATRRRAARSPTTARACSRAWPSRPSSGAAELVERCFAHILDRGGMRRTWLRGRENVQKRTLLQVAGHNLSLLMRQRIGAGTPRPFPLHGAPGRRSGRHDRPGERSTRRRRHFSLLGLNSTDLHPRHRTLWKVALFQRADSARGGTGSGRANPPGGPRARPGCSARHRG